MHLKCGAEGFEFDTGWNLRQVMAGEWPGRGFARLTDQPQVPTSLVK